MPQTSVSDTDLNFTDRSERPDIRKCIIQFRTPHIIAELNLQIMCHLSNTFTFALFHWLYSELVSFHSGYYLHSSNGERCELSCLLHGSIDRLSIYTVCAVFVTPVLRNSFSNSTLLEPLKERLGMNMKYQLPSLTDSYSCIHFIYFINQILVKLKVWKQSCQTCLLCDYSWCISLCNGKNQHVVFLTLIFVEVIWWAKHSFGSLWITSLKMHSKNTFAQWWHQMKCLSI